MKKYITYGLGDVLDLSRLPNLPELDLTPTVLNKIHGYLWGSPENANYGWKDWCHNNDFHTDNFQTSFKWTVTDNARICFIKNLTDLYKLSWCKNDFGFSELIDFPKVAQVYDAIELCMDNIYFGHQFINPRETAFYSWDCDSIMVLNKEIIIPV